MGQKEAKSQTENPATKVKKQGHDITQFNSLWLCSPGEKDFNMDE